MSAYDSTGVLTASSRLKATDLCRRRIRILSGGYPIVVAEIQYLPNFNCTVVQTIFLTEFEVFVFKKLESLFLNNLGSFCFNGVRLASLCPRSHQFYIRALLLTFFYFGFLQFCVEVLYHCDFL